MTTINVPPGGKIVYGYVNGATTQAAAMGSMLSTVHLRCGEKPQVGNVFRVRGSNSVAAFFTVVEHSQGNEQLAGMVIASEVAPNHVEAAVVTDSASRFGSTINPMLTKLSSVWNPGGAASAPNSATSKNPAPSPAASGSTSTTVLHRVSLPDNSASIGVPDGWNVKGGSGSMGLLGPHGETVVINVFITAQDSNSPAYQQMLRMGVRPLPGIVVFPANADLVKSFPQIFQLIRRAHGLGPAELQVDQIQPAPQAQAQGSRCMIEKGQIDPDGKGMQLMSMLLCESAPRNGTYNFSVVKEVVVPNSVADRDEATIAAIFGSYQANMGVISGQMAETTRQSVNNVQNVIRQRNAQFDAHEAAMASQQRANDAQHATFDQHEDDISRNGQGFSNYLLDQTVIQDNKNNTHGTVWNTTADALVKRDPNRFEIVQTPNYWKGVDY